MLTLTENASTVVKTIVEQSGPAEAGLRISQDAVDSPRPARDGHRGPAAR
ncbi:hypothetical protein [Nocardioides panacis]|nr:hypothetical protein [Nocardioides panacis]